MENNKKIGKHDSAGLSSSANAPVLQGKNNPGKTQNSSNDVLQFLLDSGMINMDDVQNEMNKRQKAQIIKNHPYAIWEGKDGRWRTRIDDPAAHNGKRLIAKKDRAGIEEFLYSYYEDQYTENGDDLNKITINDLYPEWLIYKTAHTPSPKTYIPRIESDWRTFYEGTEIIHIPIRKLDKLTLDTWAYNIIHTHQMTKNRYYNMAVIMRQCLAYAVDKKIIEINPMNLFVVSKKVFYKTKKKADHTQVYTAEELLAIEKLAWEDFYNEVKDYVLCPLAVIFQMETGVRAGELCAVRYEDIEAPDTIHIQRMLQRDAREVVNHTKTDEGDRLILLTEKAQKIIRTARKYQEDHGLDSDGYIFSHNGKPLNERCINPLLQKYCKRLGILYRSSHCLRKSYGSALISNGVNVNTVRKLLGHTDERTTLHHYCYDTNEEFAKKDLILNALKR